MQCATTWMIKSDNLLKDITMKKIYSLLAITALTLSAQTFNVATTSEFRTALETAAGNGEDDTIILADYGLVLESDRKVVVIPMF